MDTIDFLELCATTEIETGFKCYEGQPGDQQVWYGTSDKFDAFKSKVGNKIPTGSIAYLIDTRTKVFYSKFKNAWYQ